jgi:hypothetical protein
VFNIFFQLFHPVVVCFCEVEKKETIYSYLIIYKREIIQIFIINATIPRVHTAHARPTDPGRGAACYNKHTYSIYLHCIK